MQETAAEQAAAQDEIVLTEKAAQQIRAIRTANAIPEEHFLRVGVKGGGCSGLSYVLGFDGAAKETDVCFERHGVRILVDPKSLFFLSGTELDFEDGLNGKGFVFHNPKATRTCGCGSSFSA
ncbi:MAG TPA: iron-sulfur cluster assembly accessory protein [Bacteroidota bacterium]|nr:iron-sulfur cluster assembly accessory protein [Bacteroidota bacterium]